MHVVNDCNSCTVYLERIYNEHFCPEAKKKNPYKDSFYTKTLEELYKLKGSICHDSTLKHLMWICQMNKVRAEKECTTRWNFVVFFGAAAVAFLSMLTLMHTINPDNRHWILFTLMVIDFLLLVTTATAYKTSNPVRRELFYDLVLKVLADNSPYAASPSRPCIDNILENSHSNQQ